MIIETILNILALLITSVFSILPSIPDLPDSLYKSITSVIDTIFNNLGLLGVFIRPQTIIIIVPILIVVMNFERIYKVVMWILSKIPMLNIEK